MSMKTFNHHAYLRILKHAGLISISTIVLLMAGCASTMPPPTEQFAVTKASITRAASVGGNEFAPLELRAAIDKMNSAERAMADKDYVKATRLAEQAQVDAQLAETKTALEKAKIAVRNAEESERVLRREIDRITP